MSIEKRREQMYIKLIVGKDGWCGEKFKIKKILDKNKMKDIFFYVEIYIYVYVYICMQDWMIEWLLCILEIKRSCREIFFIQFKKKIIKNVELVLLGE